MHDLQSTRKQTQTSPSADGVHAVDGGDTEGFVLGTCQTVTERAQAEALVVTATGPLHHIAHGLAVGRSDGGGKCECARLYLFCHWSNRKSQLVEVTATRAAELETKTSMYPKWNFTKNKKNTRTAWDHQQESEFYCVCKLACVCVAPEISSSSISDCKLLRFSQVGGVYFFRVTYCRPIVRFALFTRFLERVLKDSEKDYMKKFQKVEDLSSTSFMK